VVERKEIEKEIRKELWMEMDLKEVEALFWEEFKLAVQHFQKAVSIRRIVALRKYCPECGYVKEGDFQYQLEFCPICKEEHKTFGKLEDCMVTHALAHVLQEFISILEDNLTANLPMVYPALIERLRTIQILLNKPGKWFK